MSCCSAPPKEKKTAAQTAREEARKEFAMEMDDLEKMQKKSAKAAAAEKAKKAKQSLSDKKALVQGGAKRAVAGAKQRAKGAGNNTGETGTALAQAGMARQQLGENMEKLQDTERTTAEMAVNAQNFASMASQMKAQEKKKSRFGF